ncbi:GIY-YIG nuclease family protein [Neptunomonas antarctica]|uniref:Putative endonuclease n=1 Tax=Neptunomonas antarctica TaxID=619304 RepID=A0A1N7KYG3_9GAMM|nr:GIY-YIG nuclease family protein [Neptunomonas antarctica]SIS66625.1 putative endonuclease [Neptunomonas antarctica]
MPVLKKSPLWHIYILLCADGTLYTGITTDCERRLKEHNNSPSLGAKYTRTRRPVSMVWCEDVASRSLAGRRECAIKQLSRAKKLALVGGL